MLEFFIISFIITVVLSFVLTVSFFCFVMYIENRKKIKADVKNKNTEGGLKEYKFKYRNIKD